ncbi:hypothetical protein [Arenicella xantha]|uniref:Uncharacterized protein n=1 Tax=Arenicella xantha TaxID=644221 RepID=A0A395JFQ1_9GAMM|nr:hypothetical protein [Arenicella xantha]RBP48487.1 hypothetical protein DFR28_10789 [Arenicella xantha]
MKQRNNLKKFHDTEELVTEDTSTDVTSALVVSPIVKVNDECSTSANDGDHVIAQEIGFTEYRPLWVGSTFVTLSEDDFLDLIPANSYFH